MKELTSMTRYELGCLEALVKQEMEHRQSKLVDPEVNAAVTAVAQALLACPLRYLEVTTEDYPLGMHLYEWAQNWLDNDALGLQ